MIAHRVKRTSGKGGYAKLGCYILDVKTPADPVLFERLASYITDRKEGAERVVAAHVTNCGSLELADAMKEIGATQDRNRRSSTDKSYHLVISFPARERPTLDQLRDIEEHLVTSIGLGDHQRISAIHDDTANLHVHVAVNKVHPTTFRNVEPYYDHPKLMAACREMELRHGLILDNHGLSVDQEHGIGVGVGVAGSQAKARDGAVKMEAHRGQESLTSWIAENAKADLAKAAVDTPTWSDLHTAFAKHGLELRQKGAGLAAGIPGTSAWVKASSIDRALSFKALSGRLGTFVGAERQAERPAPSQVYAHSPKHGGAMTANLYARYEYARATAETGRAAAVAGVNQAYASYSQELREHYRKEKAAIRARVRGLPRKEALERVEAARKDAYANRHRLAATARAQARAGNPLPTWRKFLEAEASRGDEAALAVLRARVVSKGVLGVGSLTAVDVSTTRHVVYQHLSPDVRNNGDVVYFVKDGGRVTDRSAEVRADRMSPGAAFLALSLAADRFGSRPLVVEGTEAFKSAVVEAAVIRAMDLKFSDPAMEDARRVAVARLVVGPGLSHDVQARRGLRGSSVPLRGAERTLSR